METPLRFVVAAGHQPPPPPPCAAHGRFAKLEEKDAIMEVDFSARVTAYQSARERLELLKDGVPNRQNLLKVYVTKAKKLNRKSHSCSLRCGSKYELTVLTGLPR